MWSDRRQDNLQPNRNFPATNPRPEVQSKASSLAVIGKDMVIMGQIKSKEDLHIDGQVDGKLELPNCALTVGANGRVHADITAREVETLGTVLGDVEATKKITIRKGGRLVGDLRTPGIVIEDGAYFKGKIEIVNSAEITEEMNAQPEAQKTAAAGA